MNDINPEIIDAIKAIDSNAWVGCTSNDIKKIHWRDNNPNNITEEQILSKLAELQAEYDAQEYARNRAAEYPSTGEQLDYIFHNGVAKWKTDIVQPVKDKYPKPE